MIYQPSCQGVTIVSPSPPVGGTPCRLSTSVSKVEELISYNQLLEYIENALNHHMGMDQELYRFRAIIGHQGPLLASDPDWKGSKYNVHVEWETGEITFEPLSIIAADDPVTCAAYASWFISYSS